MAPMGTDKRAQVFEAAVPIFARYGYRKTTVEEICSTAGISKRTFYEEFNDKADFFGRLFMSLGLDFTKQWEEMVRDEPSAARRIEVYVDHYVASCRSFPILQVIFESPESMQAVDDAFAGEHCKPMCEALATSLEMGVANGEFRAMNPEQVTLIIGMIMDSFFCIMPQLFKSADLVELPGFVDELKGFIINGLIAQ